MLKYTFFQEEVDFLGFTVSKDGVTTYKNKTAAIQEWLQPKNIKELQLFLSLCNYYCQFVKDYSKMALPLTELLKKEKEFTWSKEAKSTFVILKKCLVEAPILQLPDPDKEFTMTMDASDFVIGAVLSQEDEEGSLHLVAFESRKMVLVEWNYAAHEKELLAVLYALKKWRVYLEGRLFQVQTNHYSLKYL